ncbi:DUF2262 domain-containing protein [Myroides phaeus]|uniref:DUF2262 domain-containing protein n=1 Tax=Myroides phaeus TaxID=702745 RepID=UPI002DB6FAE4|nr:DUF2262 domain-containing protein [Myroides phaeus]MEC4116730.1 DUF2262 domain-containing protein [Myroides phaeus]
MTITVKDFEVADYDQDVLQMDLAHGEEEITIAIHNMDDNLDGLLADVNTIVSDLQAFDQRGKRLIVDELYDAYCEDGSITDEAFMQGLNLISLYFTGDTAVEFMYEGGDLFGGHFLTIEMANGQFDDGVCIDG